LGPLWAGAAYQRWIQAPFLSVVVLYAAALLLSGRRLWYGLAPAGEGQSDVQGESPIQEPRQNREQDREPEGLGRWRPAEGTGGAAQLRSAAQERMRQSS